MSRIMSDPSSTRMTDRVHASFVMGRRVRVLSREVGQLLPSSGSVLDVGTGDGQIARLIAGDRPGLNLTGIDTLARPDAHIPVVAFDGETIPFADHSFDYAMLVDVVHHEVNQFRLLAECARVARQGVVIKDHLVHGFAAWNTLAFMDRVGNARYGVALPYRYLDRQEWNELFAKTGLEIVNWNDRLGLYPFPANLVFERRLHFVAKLRKVGRP
jgi:SAM-dependent methyltransferase